VKLLLGMSAGAGLAVPPPSALAAPSTPISFDINAGPLAQALNSWAEQSHLKLFVPANVLNGLETTGVTAKAPAPQALARLLAGTGLTYRFTSRETVTIEPARVPAENFYAQSNGVQLETINVEGGGSPLSTMTPMPAYAGGQVASGGTVGMLGNRSVMDTPFNQTSYTNQTIQNQQARTVADVVYNDPSVTIGNSPNRGVYDLKIRGFDVSSRDTLLNGLANIAPALNLTPYFLERVEVLKGPGALLNGVPPGGSIGGMVNLVTKRAGDQPLTQLTTSYVSRGNFIGHADIGRRFGQDNAFGVRLNAAYSNGETLIGTRDNLGLVVAGLDYRGDKVRISGDVGYQSRVLTAPSQFYSFSSTLTSVPAPPNPMLTNSPPWAFSQTTDLFGMARAEVDVTNNITAYAAGGARQSRWQYFNMNRTITSTGGDFTSNFSRNITAYRDMSAEAGLRGLFNVGPTAHRINLSASETSGITDLDYKFTGVVFASNMYNRVFPQQPDMQTNNPLKLNENKRTSLAIADTISFLDDRIQITAGVRRQNIANKPYDYTTGLPSGTAYEKSAWTPGYAIVVKPVSNVSLYGNLIEGLQQGTAVTAPYVNAGDVFPPYKTRQYEAGIKADWGKLTTTFSAFQITQPNTIPSTIGGLQYLSLNGKTRNRGLEFNVFGEFYEGLRLLGGATVMDARQTQTQNGLNNGRRAISVPDSQFVIGGEWDLPFVPGLTSIARVLYRGHQYLDAANNLRIPPAARFDLGLRYAFIGPLGKPVTIRFDVQNVLNHSYWDSSSYGNASISPPRTFLLSTMMNF